MLDATGAAGAGVGGGSGAAVGGASGEAVGPRRISDDDGDSGMAVGAGVGGAITSGGGTFGAVPGSGKSGTGRTTVFLVCVLVLVRFLLIRMGLLPSLTGGPLLLFVLMRRCCVAPEACGLL
jgi:hypothetical protein